MLNFKSGILGKYSVLQVAFLARHFIDSLKADLSDTNVMSFYETDLKKVFGIDWLDLMEDLMYTPSFAPKSKGIIFARFYVAVEAELRGLISNRGDLGLPATHPIGPYPMGPLIGRKLSYRVALNGGSYHHVHYTDFKVIELHEPLDFRVLDQVLECPSGQYITAKDKLILPWLQSLRLSDSHYLALVAEPLVVHNRLIITPRLQDLSPNLSKIL